MSLPPTDATRIARSKALSEAMHLADIRGTHLHENSTAEEIVGDAKLFEKFLMNKEQEPVNGEIG